MTFVYFDVLTMLLSCHMKVTNQPLAQHLPTTPMQILHPMCSFATIFYQICMGTPASRAIFRFSTVEGSFLLVSRGVHGSDVRFVLTQRTKRSVHINNNNNGNL